MKKVIAVAAEVLFAAVSFAQKPPAAAQPPRLTKPGSGPDLAEAAAGEVTYLRYCAACHGRSLKGDGAVASGLLKVPTDLTSLTSNNGGTFPYDQVAAIIDGRKTSRVHGTPDMPVWGEIFAVNPGTGSSSSESAVRRITHYVWSRQTKTLPLKKSGSTGSANPL